MEQLTDTIEIRRRSEVKTKPMAMKKKIEKILEKEGPYFIGKEDIAKLMGGNNLLIGPDDFDVEMDKRTGNLVHYRTSELREASLQLEREENDLEKKRIALAKSDKELDIIDLNHLRLLNMQLRILDRALKNKNMYKKKSTDHPLENTLVQYPFISSSYPTESTLAKMRNNGALEQFRDGYRRMYYRNDRGKHLTIFDERTLLGIGKIWLNRERQQSFTCEFRELAEQMFIMEPSGGDYNAILNSLHNLYATSYVSEQYLDSSGKVREGVEFSHIFSTMGLLGKEGRERAVTIKLADFFHTNMLTGNYVNVNLFVFNDFDNNATKSLYPFVLSLLSNMREEYVLPIDQLIRQCNINEENSSKARSIVVRAFEELAGSDIVLDPCERKLGEEYFLYFKPPTEIGKEKEEVLS
jgi:hypothetical protein